MKAIIEKFVRPSVKSIGIPTTSRAISPWYIFLAGFTAGFLVLVAAEYIGYSKLTAPWGWGDYTVWTWRIAGAASGVVVGIWMRKRFNNAQPCH